GQVGLADRAVGAVALEEALPVLLRLVRLTEAGPPAENADLVGGVPHPATVEVEEDQAAVQLAVRVAAVEVAVAGLPPQVAGRHLDATTQQRGQRAQVAVVVRSIAQERLERAERTVEQVDEVEREAQLVAREVVASVV